jgi:hypothetical protein
MHGVGGSDAGAGNDGELGGDLASLGSWRGPWDRRDIR